MDFTVPMLLSFFAVAEKHIFLVYSFQSLTVNSRFAKKTNPKVNLNLTLDNSGESQYQ